MWQTEMVRFRSAPYVFMSPEMHMCTGLLIKAGNLGCRGHLRYPTRSVQVVSSPQQMHSARLAGDALTALSGSTQLPIKLQNTRSLFCSSLVYLHEATQNHMQAFTVIISHIILVIKTRSTACLRAPLLPFPIFPLSAPLTACLSPTLFGLTCCVIKFQNSEQRQPLSLMH